jgi:hypothetical protein
MKKLIVLISFVLLSNFSWGQSKESVKIEFNSISTSGEVVDEELFRNDSLVIVHNPGNKLAVFSFELSSTQSGISSSLFVKGNKLTAEAKEQLRTNIASGQKTFKISHIKLINTQTGQQEDYDQVLSIRVVFN